MTTLNFKTEAILDSTIEFNQSLSPNFQQPKAIFLTGSTGFLGAYLLEELLQKTTADIYCLIRVNPDETTENRLKKHLEFYQLWQENFNARIIPVIGDLSQPLLGLSPVNFDELAERIDLIYHNGAWVNSARPYLTLKPANVLGTQEVLRLASLKQTKPVHFTSTMGVFFSKPHLSSPVIRETDSPDISELQGGYRQSKWVGEQLIKNAQSRGLPANIYRPSRIIGHSKTGITGNFNDAFFVFIKGCIELKKFPDLETNLNVIPVDSVSQAMVYLSQPEKECGHTFHLVSHHLTTWAKIFEMICNLGYDLQKISYEDFIQEIQGKIADYSGKKSSLSLTVVLNSAKMLLKQKPEFNADHTLKKLAGTSIVCPPLDGELFNRYFAYWKNCGFVPSN